MINQEKIKKIKEIAEEFFKKMTIEVEIDIERPKEDSHPAAQNEERTYTVPINLKMEEPQLLIGERGQTLLELQHLLRMVFKKRIDAYIFVDLDIQDYKKKKTDYLKELARSLADEVSLTKKEKILSPMPAYERRIIHLELAERKDVVTESIGEEPDRKIVIRPCL